MYKYNRSIILKYWVYLTWIKWTRMHSRYYIKLSLYINLLKYLGIFENYQCNTILPNVPKSCALKLNRLACL